MLLMPLVLAMALIALGMTTSGPALSGVRFLWFVLGFVLLIGANGLVNVPANVHSATALGVTFLMSTGFAAMGLSTDFHNLRKRGFAPVLLGALGGCLVASLAPGGRGAPALNVRSMRRGYQGTVAIEQRS